VAHKRRRLERRGRPRKANAKRRTATTAAARVPALDQGTAELRRRKMQATTRPDLEVNGAAVLFGHEHLDRAQYDTLGMVTELLQRVARGWGALGGVTGLWYAILSAAVPTGFARPENAIASGLADSARRRLVRLCRELDGSRALVLDLAEGRVPPVVFHVLERRLDHDDVEALDRLRTGLDHIAARR
jgi:hypothetical protein